MEGLKNLVSRFRRWQNRGVFTPMDVLTGDVVYRNNEFQKVLSIDRWGDMIAFNTTIDGDYSTGFAYDESEFHRRFPYPVVRDGVCVWLSELLPGEVA